jgi:hypothetical protein
VYTKIGFQSRKPPEKDLLVTEMSDMEHDISYLRHMGFEEADIRAALQDAGRTRLDMAVNYLMQGENSTNETPRSIKSMF